MFRCDCYYIWEKTYRDGKTPRGKLRIQPIMPNWFPGLKQESLGGNSCGAGDPQWQRPRQSNYNI